MILPKVKWKAFHKTISRNPLLALAAYWVFQGMLYMDPTERWFKLGLDALLTGLGTAFLSLWFPWQASFLIAFVAAHSANFFFNGQLYALLKNYGIVHTSSESFEQFVAGLVERAKGEPSINYLAAFGSLSRRSWSPTSDFDARIIRHPGIVNGLRACWFLLLERTRALVNRFPLDMYVLDSPQSLDDRLRSDEKPVVLTEGNIPQPKEDLRAKLIDQIESNLSAGQNKQYLQLLALRDKFLVGLVLSIFYFRYFSLVVLSDFTRTVGSRIAAPSLPGWVDRSQWTKIKNALEAMKNALLTTQAALLVFAVSGAWTIAASLALDIRYQDRWILEGLWLPLLVMLIAYSLHLALSRNLRQIAILTSLMVLAALASSSLKYAYIYSTTIDASVHLSHIRSLANTGYADPNFYQHTAGLHSLIAAYIQLSGMQVEIWAKIIPPAIGSLIPLGVYMLSRRLRVDVLVAKTFIAISGLSLPLLYLPNGTRYATLLIGPLLLLLFTNHIDPHTKTHRRGFLWIGLLLLLTLIIWHGLSSFLVPFLMILVGLLAFFTPALYPNLIRRHTKLRPTGLLFFGLGLIGMVSVQFYWSLTANSLLDHFWSVVDQMLAVVRNEQVSEGVLVPERAFTFSFIELLPVLLITHARDAIMTGLAVITALGIVWSTWIRKKYGKVNDLLFLIAIVLAAFSMVVFGVLATNFSKFGYTRFLKYVMIVIPILSGYGLWISIHFIAVKLRILRLHLLLSVSIFFIYFIASIQFFPYQPAIPSIAFPDTNSLTPAYYDHKVNTDYQRRMIEFAYTKINPEASIYTDYVTFQQSVIFLDYEAKQRFRSGSWTRYTTAYVMLHHPGPAGPFAEQAEYRSAEAIQRLRQMDGVSVVYDNGESFILLVPQELVPEYRLKGE